MRAAIIALILTFGSQARAGCPDLCDENWWERATTADVQAELADGVDVMGRDQDGYAPLHGAAAVGTPESIQLLLEAGAEVMAQDGGGLTALHRTVNSYMRSEHQKDTDKKIQILLDAGADVLAKTDNGYTPLHYAAWFGTATDIKALLESGADVTAQEELGSTPLHGAAYCLLECRPGVIQALLAAGADAKAKNKEGKTPWDIAQGNERMKGTKGYWALNDAQFK